MQKQTCKENKQKKQTKKPQQNKNKKALCYTNVTF